MTLSEFIALKPPELRLGQWFVNCYCNPTNPQGWWEGAIDELYNSDTAKSKRLITQLMNMWQWDTLPDIP